MALSVFISRVSNNGLKYHHTRCKSCNQGDTAGGRGEKDTKNNTEFRRSTRTSPLGITVSGEAEDIKPRIVDDNRLRDLAIIATGPSSPLLQNISFTDRLESERCSRTVKRALDLSSKSKVEHKPG
ncbi:hypothetical protein LOTGIDRAFT_174619 [Lottia gigantea]|uniref:Uncharacterized protein n=1 Tax=Lottia gigantea TaxID=225164 RepID=V4AQJ6_LOTGI|nr:hypothetical protein LOTGIDRAFT_174619 [Lottia gigantea]ESO97095.1 hypothetical protein LOTGIDRAFT_174619 [Lottia gigantea]